MTDVVIIDFVFLFFFVIFPSSEAAERLTPIVVRIRTIDATSAFSTDIHCSSMSTPTAVVVFAGAFKPPFFMFFFFLHLYTSYVRIRIARISPRFLDVMVTVGCHDVPRGRSHISFPLQYLVFGYF